MDGQKDSLPTYFKSVINRATKTSAALHGEEVRAIRDCSQLDIKKSIGQTPSDIYRNKKKPSSKFHILDLLTAEMFYWIIPILYAQTLVRICNCRLPACSIHIRRIVRTKLIASRLLNSRSFLPKKKPDQFRYFYFIDIYLTKWLHINPLNSTVMCVLVLPSVLGSASYLDM